MPRMSVVFRSLTSAVHQDLSWLTELMRRHLPEPVWTSIPQVLYGEACASCAPRRPQLLWASSDGASIHPIEDFRAANDFERAIKNRPSAMKIETDTSSVSLHINPLALAHRVAAELQPAVMTEANWRLTEQSLEKAFTFKPLRLQTTTGGQLAREDIGKTCRLFPVQRLVLSWMQEQEKGVDMTLQAMQEACLAEHNWKLEVRGQANHTVRGGICADHPGFGKTITSLALIGIGFSHEEKQTTRARQQHDFQLKNLITTYATLVVCPQSLVRQWANEMRNKLGWREKRDFIVISKVAQLDNHTIEHWKAARVILISRKVLIEESYLRRLATFAACPPPASSSGRLFVKWLAFVRHRFREHVPLLLHLDQQALPARLRAVMVRTTTDACSLHERTRQGVAEVATSKRNKQTAALNDKDFGSLTAPLVEMFYFSRLIVDEFHDLSPQEHASITNICADRRWVLSATPKMNDMYDISQMAALIGVPLQYGSLSISTIKIENIRNLQKAMTDFERFDSLREVRSPAAHAQMYEMDKLFLSTFVRQNLMDFGEIMVHQHLIPVALPLDHCALYHELATKLIAQGMVIKKNKKPDVDADERFIAATRESCTAEQALVRYATRRSDDRDLAAVLETAQKEVVQITQDLSDAIHSAHKTLNDVLDAIDVASMMDEQLYCDELQDFVRRLVARLDERKTVLHKRKRGEAAHAKANVEELSSALLQHSRLLSAAIRSLRYLSNVEKYPGLVCHRSYGTMGSMLSHSDVLAISTLCGHVICQECYKQSKTAQEHACKAPGCASMMLEEGLLWSSVMSDSPQSQHHDKFEAVLGILNSIAAKSEKAVVFVQHSSELESMSRILKQNRVKHVVVNDSSKADRQVSDFQRDTKMTAIILNASDETAAGLNLQIANHVVFLSPLLRTTQYSYDATMAQAIGRVKRHGQHKEVHVYRVYALHTIDVDILEHREPTLGLVSGHHGWKKFSEAYREDDQES